MGQAADFSARKALRVMGNLDDALEETAKAGLLALQQADLISAVLMHRHLPGRSS
jgi:hypothetical protein